jgi:hypothetical protein
MRAVSHPTASRVATMAEVVTVDQSASYPNVEIPRQVPTTRHRFLEYFKGFEKLEAVKETFGDETDKILRNLEVEFFGSKFGYMGVSDEDGHILASAEYLKNGNQRDIYLDVIHELVHVKQFKDGKELFDESYEYAERPTEVEAYKHTVKEARRLGMKDDEIFEYLKVTWLSDSEVKQLAKNVGVSIPQKSGRGRRARIS